MINQAGEYALRAVVYLSRETPGTPSSASEIAQGTKVPQAYLQKILRTMTQHNLLIAQRGAGGGFMLAKLPSAISVLDVLKACDSNPSRIERCPLGIQGHTELCALHSLIDKQAESAESVFATTSIAQLVDTSAGSSPLCNMSSTSSKPINLGLPKDRTNQDKQAH